MNRGLLVKLVVVLLVAILIHSVFWFFKTGQLEKHVNNFIAENSGNVSASEINVTGFPFSQHLNIKDLKFSIPSPAFNKYQIIVKNLEARSGIFSNDFTVELLDKVVVQDSDNNTGSVEFTQAPQIAFLVRDGLIAHFSYQDVGHNVLDIDKNVIYSAASTMITVDSVMDGNEQITSRILANVKDIENFTLLDAYKNSSEKKIIDAIKTGEINLSNSSDASISGALPAPTSTDTGVVVNAAQPAVVPSAMTIDLQQANANPQPNPEAVVVANNEPNKGNLIIDFEYVLTPSRADQQATIPLDPAQMQESNMQYNKALKINNLEYANNNFKVIVNGQVNSFQDDNMPSGFVTIRVDNASNFVTYIVDGFNQMAQQKPILNEVQTSDLAAQASAPQDAYQNFLKKIAAGLPTVSKELSAKNQLSKDNSAVFDVRREKNLEFVINETPLREVLGKF